MRQLDPAQHQEGLRMLACPVSAVEKGVHHCWRHSNRAEWRPTVDRNFCKKHPYRKHNWLLFIWDSDFAGCIWVCQTLSPWLGVKFQGDLWGPFQLLELRVPQSNPVLLIAQSIPTSELQVKNCEQKTKEVPCQGKSQQGHLRKSENDRPPQPQLLADHYRFRQCLWKLLIFRIQQKITHPFKNENYALIVMSEIFFVMK